MVAAVQDKVRGHVRLELIRDLAIGEMTHDQIAEKYGKAYQTIAGFSSRNKAEIAEVRRQLGGEFSGLWVVEKRNRIAEYQQKFEDLQEKLDTEAMSAPAYVKLVHAQFKALNAVAEEMGHLPTRTPGEGPAPVVMRYEVVGVDLQKHLIDPAPAKEKVNA